MVIFFINDNEKNVTTELDALPLGTPLVTTLCDLQEDAKSVLQSWEVTLKKNKTTCFLFQSQNLTDLSHKTAMTIIMDTVHSLEFFLLNIKSEGEKNITAEYDQSNSQCQIEVQGVPSSNSSRLAIVVSLSNCRQMRSHYILIISSSPTHYLHSTIFCCCLMLHNLSGRLDMIK